MTGIEFYRVSNERSLLELLAVRDRQLAPEWLSTGSVYVEGVRALKDRPVARGQVIRLHTRRKRYPTPPSLKDRIVYEGQGLLVLDKPAGLPVHPTLDNYLENAKTQLEQELGRTLYTTHRLDIPTRGLLIFATEPAAQVRLNKFFARGDVRKIYHALTARPVPPGEYQHFVDSTTRVPRSVYTTPGLKRWECRLVVEDGGSSGPEFWARVRLLTGKTHQIRLQFAAMGAPLIGDETYGSLRPGPLGLECYEMSFRWLGQDLVFTRPESIR